MFRYTVTWIHLFQWKTLWRPSYFQVESHYSRYLSPLYQSKTQLTAYSKQLLELGLLFKDILDFEGMPERERGLRIFKLLMLYLKSHKNLSKYAFELLRLLVHQQSLLIERKAHEEFYDLFVNTKSQYNTHIPVDLRMEFHVKEVKKHIKHMTSNKTHSNISNRTKTSVKEIAENYDNDTSVVKRSKKHGMVSTFQAEMIMLQDLRKTSITETTPCAIGNFRKWLLYKCFMSLSLIVIQTNIKFLKVTVTWTNIW